MPAMTARLRPHRAGRGLRLATLGALVPLVVFGGFAALEAQRSYSALDEARLSGTARALAAAVDAQLKADISALSVFSEARILTEPLDVPRFTVRARQVGAALGGPLALYGPPPEYPLHADARAEAEAPAAQMPALPEPMIEALHRVFAERRPTVSDLLIAAPSAELRAEGRAFLVVVPVFGPAGIHHALALRLRPVALRRLLADQGLPSGTFAAIADGGLRIVASTLDPEGQRTGQPAPGWVGPAMAGRQRGVVTGRGLNTPAVTYAFEHLAAAPGWTVTVAQPVAAQRAAAWNAVGWAAGGAAAVAGGLLVLVWGNRRDALRAARLQAEALQRGRAEIERLHAGLPAMIFLDEIAPDGANRRLYVGGDIEAVTGWPPATIAAEANMTRFSGPERPSFRSMAERAQRDGATTLDWRMQRPNGAWQWMRSTLRVLEARPDGSLLVVGHAVNVTAEREAEARANAAGRLASLGEMATGLAHELKQPLAIIAMAAQNALRAAARGDTEGVTRRLATILAQTMRGGTIIDHLRRFAGASSPAPPPEPVPLAAAVEGALGLVGSTLREALVQVEVALGEPPPVVLGHRCRSSRCC